MSMFFREHGHLEVKQYEQPGRTKQAFKDDADVNRILDKFRKTGTITHLNKFGAQYGDFADMPDLLQAHERLKAGHAIFGELPAEVRAEFAQDAGKFFAFVNDPANKDDLPRLLPAIAQRGRYDFDLSPRTPPGASRDPDAPEPGGAADPPPVTGEGDTGA